MVLRLVHAYGSSVIFGRTVALTTAPAGVPPVVDQTLIAGNEDFYFFHRDSPGRDRPPPFFADEALADYVAAHRDPRAVHATCEDYRAAAILDHQADEVDLGTRKIACPLLALWATDGLLPKLYDTVAVWKDWADDVRGQAITGGHYLAEQNPRETYRAMVDFFGEGPASGA
ncbi:MAG TPA: hypothetical protein VF755_22835 [Catenuloplanes sp.]